MRGGKEVCNGSPLRRYAAISWLFGRAILSLRLRFSVSVLALSVTFGDSSPRGRAIGVSVGFHAGRPRPDRAQKGGPCYRGQARLRTTSQSASQTAPLVGEPLAKPFTLRGLPKPPLLGATATTAASGGNREELLGPRPAGCERQRSRRWEPQPGQWHRASDDGEGKPVSREPPCSDKLSLWQSDAIAAPAILRQRPCPLSHLR